MEIPGEAIPDPVYECWRCFNTFEAWALRYVFSRPNKCVDKGRGFACRSCCNLIDTDDFTVTDITLDGKLA